MAEIYIKTRSVYKRVSNVVTVSMNNTATGEERIKVNVLGRVFEVRRQTLQKIPYIADMWHGCETEEGEIYIERSASLFEHVIAFVVDDTYPFPAMYEQELRFYGVPYVAESLYKPDGKLLETWLLDHNETTNALKWLGSGLASLVVHSQKTEIVLSDLCGSVRKTPYSCHRCYGSVESYRGRKSTCKGCEKYCSAKGCQTLSDEQYCKEHLPLYTTCNTKNCIWTRLPNTTLCIYHTRK